MKDLNDALSTDLHVVFFEARAINYKGQILAMGKDAHDSGLHGETATPQEHDCAPAPPSMFLLTP